MGFWQRLRGRRDDAPVALYRAVVAAARQPVWYRTAGVPDTLDGRFDMVAAILALVLIRIEREGDAGRAPAARLAEIFIDDMDSQLREAGVGDVVVGKHVGRMMGALGGRLAAIRDGLAPGGDLDGALLRNVYRGHAPDPAAVAVLRDGLVTLDAALAAMPAAELLDGAWPR